MTYVTSNNRVCCDSTHCRMTSVCDSVFQGCQVEIAVAQPVETIRNFAEMRERARAAGPRRLGIVYPEDDVSLAAASDALAERIAFPVLIGNEPRIRARAAELGLFELLSQADFVSAPHDAAAQAVSLAREGSIDMLMKGHLRTDELFHPVLDRQSGLRTGHLMHDVALFEYGSREQPRLVAISDCGLTVAPTLDQKRQIILGVIEVLHRVGITRPRIAIMSAVEIATEAMPSTLDAEALTGMSAAGAFGDADVYGPLALDNALFPWAAEAKGIFHPVAGHADALIMPNIEAGNLLAKSILFLACRDFGHVVVGASVPILIPSRVESAAEKLNAIALGVVCAG